MQPINYLGDKVPKEHSSLTDYVLNSTIAQTRPLSLVNYLGPLFSQPVVNVPFIASTLRLFGLKKADIETWSKKRKVKERDERGEGGMG